MIIFIKVNFFVQDYEKKSKQKKGIRIEFIFIKQYFKIALIILFVEGNNKQRNKIQNN